jgi:4-hydroxyphenylpyruvate dioxygenase-like putative hemolysin
MGAKICLYTFSILFQGSSDQITTFIAKHNGQAGIQHMALTCTNGIKEVVRTTKANGAQFLAPCLSYYSQVCKS